MLGNPPLAGKRLLAMGMALIFCTAPYPAEARSKLAAPAPISDVYSDADMRLYLATLPTIETPCTDEECELNRAFDHQVQRAGARVAAAAYDMHPDLIHRIKNFEFQVIEKKNPGVTSNASGTIVVMRGTQQIGLNDEALSFMLAREMGHVIAQHHDENTTTRILLSVAAGILFPALNLFGNTAAVAQATSSASATTLSSATLATTAASTATSYLGAKLVLNSLKPEQLSEADQIGLKLMEKTGLSHRDLALALENSAEFHPSNEWSEDFRNSITQVRSLESAAYAGEVLPEIDSPQHPIMAQDDAGMDMALLDAEGNPLPPLEDAASIETSAAAPAPDRLAMTSTEITPPPAPAKAPAEPVHVDHNAESASNSIEVAQMPLVQPRRHFKTAADQKGIAEKVKKTGQSGKKNAGKSSKQKIAKNTAGSKKASQAKSRKAAKPATSKIPKKKIRRPA